MIRAIPATLIYALYQWRMPGLGEYGMCSCCGSTPSHGFQPEWKNDAYDRAPANYIGVTEFKPNSLDELNEESKKSVYFRYLFEGRKHFIVKDKETAYGNVLLSWVDEGMIEAHNREKVAA